MIQERNELTQLLNIGEKLSDQLIQAGIKDAKDLKSIGVERAFIKLKTMDNDTCLNALFAIEGAIQGIRWHALSEQRKAELKEFFKLIDKKEN
nr:TfoX/Sxy family protein [uncultured Draconibacterium sp.]